MPNGPGWWQFRYLILTLFLGTVGISLSLAHGVGIRWRAFWRRFLVIGLAALAVSLASLLVFRQSWIYFGILHFIWIASLIGLGLVRYPGFALGLGLTVLLVHWTGLLPPRWPFDFIDSRLPAYTEDFVSPLPWLGVVFIGVWIGSLIGHKKLPSGPQNLPLWMAFPARHSLPIYLLHQPLLFGLFFLLAS